MSGVAKNENQVSGTQAIPTRRVVLNDPSQMPTDYSTTPGGTLFSTTPGGTRIIYDRKFLLQIRNSPLAKSPPANLPRIPGVTAPAGGSNENGFPEPIQEKPKDCAEDASQFQMDI